MEDELNPPTEELYDWTIKAFLAKYGREVPGTSVGMITRVRKALIEHYDRFYQPAFGPPVEPTVRWVLSLSKRELGLVGNFHTKSKRYLRELLERMNLSANRMPPIKLAQETLAEVDEDPPMQAAPVPVVDSELSVKQFFTRERAREAEVEEEAGSCVAIHNALVHNFSFEYDSDEDPTVGWVMSKSEAELLKMALMGKRKARLIKMMLAQAGLSLKKGK